jgi:hypothetical protein
MDRPRHPDATEHSVPSTSGDVVYDVGVLADETRRSQRVSALVALSFAGAAIGLGSVILAIAGIVRDTPAPAPRAAVIGFTAFALVRIAVLALAGLAYLAKHRRARVLGLAWAALAIADSLIAVFALGAPPLAALAGALAPIITIAVLLVRPPRELVFTL